MTCVSWQCRMNFSLFISIEGTESAKRHCAYPPYKTLYSYSMWSKMDIKMVRQKHLTWLVSKPVNN